MRYYGLAEAFVLLALERGIEAPEMVLVVAGVAEQDVLHVVRALACQMHEKEVLLSKRVADNPREH